MTTQEKIELKRVLEQGMDTPFWKRVKELVDAQVRARRIASFNLGVSSIDTAFEQARAHGEVSGLQLALALPQFMIDDLTADIEVELQKEREDSK